MRILHILFALLLCAAFPGLTRAQFLSSCSRQKIENKVIRDSDPISWVTLINAEETQVNKSAAYGQKLPAFTQSQPPQGKGHQFSVRFHTIQRAINGHTLLRGYTLVVPQPADLLKLREWEIEALATFFKQGTTYETIHRSFEKTISKKLQDAVVEVRFYAQTSEHTAIMLADCRHRKLYLFIDSYKNSASLSTQKTSITTKK